MSLRPLTPPPPNFNRIKFTDDENKVLVQKFDEIASSETLNDAKAVIESGLHAITDAQKSLAALANPLQAVLGQLNSGAAASEMMASIQNTVNTNLPQVRALTASINAVVSNATTQAVALSKSVTGALNNAMSGVPLVMGKVDEISSGVKTHLLQTGVDEYLKGGMDKLSTLSVSASNQLGALTSGFGGVSNETMNRLLADPTSLTSMTRTGVGLLNEATTAVRSIQAAKQNFNPTLLLASMADALAPPTTAGGAAQTALRTQIQQVLDNTNHRSASIGTTSELPSVTSYHNPAPVMDTTVQLTYSSQAIVFLTAMVTWFRSLSTHLFQESLPRLEESYGQADNHYRHLSGTAGATAAEQFANFQALCARSVPDMASKTYYVYGTLQTITAYIVEDLDDIPTRQNFTGLLNHYLSTHSVKSLLTSDDYDQLIVSLQRLIGHVRSNHYQLTSQDSADVLIAEAFQELATDAMVYHLSAPASITKRQHAPGTLAAFCGVYLIRELLSEIELTQATQWGLNTIYNTQLRSLTCSYNDPHGFVYRGKPIYWRPTTKAFTALPFALVKHYHLNHASIVQARESLVSDQEKYIFDHLIERLDTLRQRQLPQYTAITNHPDKVLTATTQTHRDMAYSFSLAVVTQALNVSDTVGFPAHCFDTYAVEVDSLYLDETTAIFR